MPQSREWRETDGVRSCDASPLPGAPASNISGPNSPTSALTGVNVEMCSPPASTEQASASPTGSKVRKAKCDKRYLGVRVRLPVRDMLRNFRIAKGIDPKDLQQKESKGSQGDKKRVPTSSNRRKRLKWQTKSLEELAFIVEVLEEDLKATKISPRQPNEHLSSTFCPEPGGEGCCKTGFQRGTLDDSPPTPSFCDANEKIPTQPTDVYNSFLCSDYSQSFSPVSDSQEGCYSWNEMTCFPGESEYEMPSPQESSYLDPMIDHWWNYPEKMHSPCSVQDEWNSMTFFWTQVEREEHLLKGMCDRELLAVNETGRTLLHRSVDEGKRALVYVIAKRMADLKKLDAKDTDGKTPLHIAAQRNQHLIVADLISLGANVNEKDRYGKTCLHLSAECGYVRVLEVLKSCMKNGTYIDLEAKDINGLSALQLASVALKNTVHELEKSITAGQTRLFSLRKEQMMETLECLLQMECNLQYQVI